MFFLLENRDRQSCKHERLFIVIYPPFGHNESVLIENISPKYRKHVTQISPLADFERPKMVRTFFNFNLEFAENNVFLHIPLLFIPLT